MILGFMCILTINYDNNLSILPVFIGLFYCKLSLSYLKTF